MGGKESGRWGVEVVGLGAMEGSSRVKFFFFETCLFADFPKYLLVCPVMFVCCLLMGIIYYTNTRIADLECPISPVT